MPKSNGGPAFPCGSYDPATGYEQPPVIAGMTLRDWFAGQALAGMLAQLEVDSTPEDDARMAYQVADAMLASREEASDGEE